MILNSRQRELLRVLLSMDKPISYKDLSDIFKFSIRTIQREMKGLHSYFDSYNLKLVKRMGKGIELSGDLHDKQRLNLALEQVKILNAYSQSERQEGIVYDLLLAKEPIKQYTLSKKYDVAELTISNDMDKINKWLEKDDVKIVKTPGIGVYIDGTEQQRRTILSRLLHRDITFEDWIELFQGKKGEERLNGKLGLVIRSRLLKFVQTDKILDIDRVLQKALLEHPHITLTDRNYVNLIVHVILALERIQSGEVIEENITIASDDWHDPEIYSLAELIVEELEKLTSLKIPRIEINYIALHLAGTRIDYQKKPFDDDNQDFTWIELTKSFIRAIEHFLDESLIEDKILFEGLLSHFAPAFNRLKHGLQIHNPMQDKIIEMYPEIYHACQKACELIAEKTGYTIPEEEVGYLAMHIGASQLRKHEQIRQSYRCIVVCTSGVGSSTYLATRIRTEMPSLSVEAVLSLKELEEWLDKGESFDIVISTVNVPFLQEEKMVIVTPFLKEEDIKNIEHTLIEIDKHQLVIKSEEQTSLQFSSILPLAKYGEALLQILKNFVMFQEVKIMDPMIDRIASLLDSHQGVSDIKKVVNDLEKREEQGGFVLGNLAMMHAKTKGVNEIIVSIFRMEEPILWKNDNEEVCRINVILMLAVPVEAPKEHKEMISEITAMLVDDQFVNTILNGSQELMENSLEDILLNAYELKITASIKELQRQ
ncbi:BglG family transcription antiterminator [Gracilibacillus kekensis]|uniref:Transcriptional antiterminator, BglG family n=1 Tax=Gracilibacillus kekensis TaxID=1027249 RepID=A0A1M7QRG6_9BACI|nr:BglG family transcription antiterminator [Gracilibacillus kekensis]SHN33930.1 transcriptional antiterminator, BglG family [Gracilibacillus kekensis]